MGPVRALIATKRCGDRERATGAAPPRDLRGLAAAVGNRQFAQIARQRQLPARAVDSRFLGRAAITIGAADDAFEREADRVMADGKRPTSRKPASPAARNCPTAPHRVHDALASPGRPLDSVARRHFEQRLGADLGAVRIHDGPAAATSASAVSAVAYTVGSHVVLARAYRHDDPVSRAVLGHELAHVIQQPDGRVLRRMTCERLLDSRASRATSGPRVSEDSVQEFLADELEETGDIVRELRVPGASAAPWRTDGGRDPKVIDPQVIGDDVTGRIDIAYHPYSRQLEFLEIKEASWHGRVFAQQQLENYVIKGNDAIGAVRKEFRRRGHPHANFDYVASMPTGRYTPPSESPVEIAGRLVMLAWCGEGVMLFKTLDTDNRAVHYCGVSDRGATDQFLDHVMGEAEDAVARALAWRLHALMGGPVNLKLLLKAVRERLKSSIRYFLEKTMQTLCAAAFELTAAELLAAFKRRLQLERELVEVFLGKFTPEGQHSKLQIPEASVRDAQAVTAVLIVLTLLAVPILAFF